MNLDDFMIALKAGDPNPWDTTFGSGWLCERYLVSMSDMCMMVLDRSDIAWNRTTW